MILTGKCKEEFGKWLVCGEGSVNFEKYYSDEYGDDDPYLWFTELPASMQYGVYVDFFDSVGIYIIISRDSGWYDVDIAGEWTSTTTQDNRTEARTLAIEKANEIYNKI